MLLRISLIIAILAGGAALYFTHFNVVEKITTLQTDLKTTTDAKVAAEADASKAKKDARASKEQFEQASKDLATATEKLQDTAKKLLEQQNRANTNYEQLQTTKGELRTVQEELAQWRVLGVKPEQVQQLQADLKENIEAKETFASENKILTRKIGSLEARLSKYEGNPRVALPSGLRGKVLAVDPKYDFVVLDVGENQGVRENGALLVNRNGKLIAKLQITRVQANRSIANILPEDRLGDVREGDEVIIE